MHILVTDDKSLIREKLTALLERHGHVVQTAFNGLDALEKAQKETYDVFIIDHLMPIMNGLQLSKNLKKLEDTSSIPIVFMTTQNINQVENLTEAQLFKCVMAKPLNEASLLSALRQLDKKLPLSHLVG